jgi:two-component system, NarL family, sensor histidine kinase DevS
MRVSDEYSPNDLPLLLARLQSIASTVMYAAGADTLGGVLERLAETARDLVGARYAALGVPDGTGDLEYFEFVGMTADEANRIAHKPIGRGLLGAIMLEREPIRLERMQDDPRSIGFPAHHPHMESFLGVPILVGDHLFGMLYLTDRADGQPFTEQDQWLIETTAGYAALAIAGAQLREKEKRVALLEERERISMELHDGIIQSLYAIGMNLELLRLSEQVNPPDLTQAINNLDAVIGDIRSYIQNLKASERLAQSLEQALHDIVDRLHFPTTLNVHIEPIEQEITLSPTAVEAVCQMANEALSNVIRHANAQHIHVSAQQSDHFFQLSISDDGKGFDLSQVEREDGGLGLRNMQQRARLQGGSIEIKTAPGEGTKFTLRLPV